MCNNEDMILSNVGEFWFKQDIRKGMSKEEAMHFARNQQAEAEERASLYAEDFVPAATNSFRG